MRASIASWPYLENIRTNIFHQFEAFKLDLIALDYRFEMRPQAARNAWTAKTNRFVTCKTGNERSMVHRLWIPE